MGKHGEVVVIISHFRRKKQNQFEFNYVNSSLYIKNVNTELYLQSSKLVHVCNVLAVNCRYFVVCCLRYRCCSIVQKNSSSMCNGERDNGPHLSK